MSSSISKSASKTLPVQLIVFAEISWAVLTLLFFLLFSVPDPGQARPTWYSYGTAIFEIVAFFGAALLCLRNWLSPQIVSGRRVWIGLGSGMLCYSLGSLLFTFWETYLGRDAGVSPGDFLYIPTYLFLGWGMVMAFTDRRLNLDLWQWLIVGAIAAMSIVFAIWLTLTPVSEKATADWFGTPVSAQTAPATPKASSKATPKASSKAAPKAAQTAAKASPAASPTPKSAKSAPAVVPTAPQKGVPAAEQPKQDAPGWVTTIENALAPLETYFNYFYIMADVFILIIATALLLAFWGGRFSQSWRMIAAAAFSLYIADMWFKYATTKLTNYQSGGFLEIFWVLSGVLFGIGAALEHDLSRSRRAGTRKRA